MNTIDRVAIHIGSIQIYWYGIIIGMGVFIGLWLAMRESKRRGLDKDLFVDLLIYAVPISIISARIYYVIFEWSYYKDHLGDIYKIWNGGIAIHGALIGAVITTIFFARSRNISFWKIADIAAPSLILAQGIGRWGNFINQEAYGDVVSRQFLENLMLPDFIIDQMFINGAYHHPTFLYESLWNFLGFGLLLLLRRVNLRQGEMFLTYVIWYSIGRYFIEGMRTDSLMLFGEFRMAQVLSLSLIIGGIILLVVRRKMGYSEKKYLDI
ncbi:prolipoprotein diacylglyceryl transferase [Pradoshia sp. D12]|uniref:prolipoprotein diacylglyceryl transferase n=1 Tax=Bacillaceae TaxID=186817 RepID=UPI00111F004C|nr:MULTISPECIES: prolipoprotein diacylglyceryl transferase [Bacillaceae]QFK72822.1 prolipoprotein diacylglyceryl transferase [Pradoshia sp. D12]TPF71816.1 prolipoprotein diacylglyceryl transferase [Bacillus sp. D12]